MPYSQYQMLARHDGVPASRKNGTVYNVLLSGIVSELGSHVNYMAVAGQAYTGSLLTLIIVLSFGKHRDIHKLMEVPTYQIMSDHVLATAVLSLV